MEKIYGEKAREKIPYFLTGLALFGSVYFSGGLNWQNCICSSLLLLISLFLGRVKKIEYGIPLLLLFCLCFASCFVSMGNPQTGIYEAYKFICFIMAVMVGLLLKSDKKILRIIFFNALIVAVVGILACCGIMNFEEFTFKDNNIVRLQSFIKYANVTASFLGCGYISFLELFISEKKRAYLYGGGCILTAMYFTFSKACLPIFLIVCTIYIYKKKELSKVFLVQNIIAIILLPIMLITVPKHMYFILLVLTAIGVLISGKIGGKYDKCFLVWLIILTLTAAGAIGIVLLKPSLAGTFFRRIEYMKDALRLIKNNPLLGCGFGSWRVLQYKVQTEQYSVTYLHNGILQMIVENGIAFTAVFLGINVYAIINGIKRKKYHFAAMALTILIHSIIDCDLSFGVVLITLGLTVGSMLPGKNNVKTYNNIVNCLLVMVLCISDLYMITEYAVRSSFENAYIQNDYDKAADRLDKLAVICPLDAEVKAFQANIEEKTTNDESEIRNKLKEAIDLSPYDTGMYENYMNYAFCDDNLEDMCMKYMELAPKQEKTYAYLKQYLLNAKESGMISDETYSKLYSKVENRRIAENVIDRNELLNQIAGNER